MLRLCFILFLSVSVFHVASQVRSIRPFKGKTTAELLLAESNERLTGYSEKSRYRATLLKTEKWLLRNNADELLAFAWLALMLICMALFTIKKRRQNSHLLKSAAKGFEVLAPQEEYLDAGEFFVREKEGFATKQEAIDWVSQDLADTCDYCAGKMQALDGGSFATLQMITFYKSVPEDAQDMRVILGSAWYVDPAEALICGSCGRQLKR